MNKIFWLILLIFLIIVILFARRGNYEMKPVSDDDIRYLFNSEDMIEYDLDKPDTTERTKGEKITCDIMKELFGVPFPRKRPNFLKNPSTGRNLELDCYNDDLKLAVEYNGPTHYKYPNFTGQTKAQFLSQLQRDKFKIKRCEEVGVHLIIVPYTIPYNKIKEYIIKKLPLKYLNLLKNGN